MEDCTNLFFNMGLIWAPYGLMEPIYVPYVAHIVNIVGPPFTHILPTRYRILQLCHCIWGPCWSLIHKLSQMWPIWDPFEK